VTTGGWSAAPATPPGRFRTAPRASGDDEPAAPATTRYRSRRRTRNPVYRDRVSTPISLRCNRSTRGHPRPRGHRRC
jgi:hypothetical protein